MSNINAMAVHPDSRKHVFNKHSASLELHVSLLGCGNVTNVHLFSGRLETFSCRNMDEDLRAAV